jgi:shikimate kinase
MGTTDDGHVVLVGPMGVGKTAVGRALAEALDRPLLDADVWIERAEGRTGAEIAQEHGLLELHRLELGVFLEMVDRPEPSVIAPAESVIDDPGARDALSLNTTFWLDADPAVLAARRGIGTHRRQIDTEEFERRRKDRAVHLAQCSVARIDTAQSIHDCLRAILDAMPS